MSPEVALSTLLERYDRIVIAGVSDSGKTTLAKLCTDREIVSTDDWLENGPHWVPGLRWKQVTDFVAQYLSGRHRWVLEGVRAPGAVVDGGAPAQAILWLGNRHPDASPPTPKQLATAEGRRSNWRKHLPELRRRGVEIVEL